VLLSALSGSIDGGGGDGFVLLLLLLLSYAMNGTGDGVLIIMGSF